AVEEDRRYVMDHFAELVVKSRGGYGGKEVMIGPEETTEGVEKFRRMVEENPVEYIAQETIDFSTHVLCETKDEGFLLRDSYADYRVLVLAPDAEDPGVVEAVPGSLSRVAAPGKHVVNISSGGKMKDTWVLER
ncbi:MAG: circularly permuted type 2 ATP-grasp protein, partial [Rubrobacter sp.]|nr:circularly permuted type 2 ATP-grasp protein [Rubrobacter sp.]